MNKTEARKAVKLLNPVTQRVELAANGDGGVSVTAYWFDGSQRVFHALDALEAAVLKTFEVREGDGNEGTYRRGTVEAVNAFEALRLASRRGLISKQVEAVNAFEALRLASRRGLISKPRDVVLSRDIDGDEQNAYAASFVSPIYGDACRWTAEAHLIAR